VTQKRRPGELVVSLAGFFIVNTSCR